ncbi:sugar transferase [Chitinophaga nivalis]|uniref:Sugar transferase n=1 Tax=Chitinophaga nivalis TaxID=2991709 RepID=A0ABT3INX2_9BACT|nr:sugar transferase [Chitinophaga nivalis]MCW3464671.1 sugar transferase [Chitinophaga nivalis]MCW3485638.1 sugar transferase [Chitinophaga nivalis]
MQWYRNIFKPVIDAGVALVALLLFSPVMVLLTLLLLIANNGKAFFLQPRPGKDDRVFRVIKFKTMNDRRDSNGEFLPDDVRLTPVGKFIRKTSLDELPQLINVLKGDMSLIGPRPLLVDYLPLYDAIQQRRHEVRPGITGWAQVNGRNAISWKQKFELDVWYVDHISLGLDLKIIGMTLQKVIRSEGISSATTATMERFLGN